MTQINKVLIIEDSHLMRLQVKQILEQANFEVMELEDAKEVFSDSWRYRDVGVILLDINLPGMDGLSVLREMNKNKLITWPPVIILSSSSDRVTITTAMMLGAKEYIIKPFNADALIQKVQHISNYSAPLKFWQRYLELVQVLKEAYELYIAGDCKSLPQDSVTVLFNECEKIVQSDETMILFHKEFNMSDYSFTHAINVAILSGVIAKWMNLKEKEIRELVLAGLLHDLGKARIPRDLVLKSGKLSNDEMDILKTHPTESYNLIKDQDFPMNVLLGVSQHHERMDGSGYPNRLLGKDISLAARIIAVADVYDAMTSNKVYRQAENTLMAIEELFKEMFSKLDPHICSVFLKNVKKHLVGQRVHLSDGSEAKVVRIEGDGFGSPILERCEGKVF